ncbi:cerebral cavernous malformations protein 2 homolog [Watersipora subatra]|uniref:cerebral cavernous malformations protein 2 homolog n=1 Tax=Watersipora subatra TaxID=2589382 RepID=UPI00355AE3F3
MDRADKKNNSSKKEKEEQKRIAERLQARRPLHTFTLEAPEYTIRPEILLKDGGYYEKELRYAGIIRKVSFVLDSTNRTEVLRIIDRGIREGDIPYTTSMEHDAIFSLNVNNIKISKRDGDEETLLRIPIAEVANICYIQDDSQSLLALKYGNPAEDREICKLAVMYADKPESAHEICSLVGQCFQIVYTEATMQAFDKNLEHNGTYSSHPGSTGTSTFTGNGPLRLHELVKPTPQFMTSSTVDRSVSSHSTVSVTSSRYNQRRRASESESDVPDTVSTSDGVLREYMDKLPKKLNPEELKQFATLLHQWLTMGLPFEDFCNRVVSLYGPHRKNLLQGMRYFIPEKDAAFFEGVLEREGVVLDMEATLKRS